jgi:beta-lactamase superfamily II metal-dependent hydrolase
VSTATQAGRTLDIYVIDVEGGEATLFVSPSGESLLVDTGWPGFDGRDADRIAEAAAQAGIRQIDHLLITHYHADHFGGTAQLAERLPIRRYYDHGPMVDQGERAQAQFRSYADLRRSGTHRVVSPGDTIPVADLDVSVIASAGATLRTPLAGGGAPNPLCQAFAPHGPEITGRAADAEDLRSVSLSVRYGRFRAVIMGDLTWNKEEELMCPINTVGTVDAYLVSHHGSDTSGSEALVHALRPRVAIMNNGPRKGGAIQTFRILAESPSLEDLWQTHFSVIGGDDYNPPAEFIANLDEGSMLGGAAPGAAPVHMGPASRMKLSAGADGGFSVTNSRNGFTKRYAPRD